MASPSRPISLRACTRADTCAGLGGVRYGVLLSTDDAMNQNGGHDRTTASTNMQGTTAAMRSKKTEMEPRSQYRASYCIGSSAEGSS